MSSRLIPVGWENDHLSGSAYLTELQISAYDRAGLLAEITSMLYDMKILIAAILSIIPTDVIVCILKTFVKHIFPVLLLSGCPDFLEPESKKM